MPGIFPSFADFMRGGRAWVQKITTSLNESKGLAENVTERIRNAHVFLQIIPSPMLEESKHDLEWLLYELGVACGSSIPCAVCVDERKAQEWPPKVAHGWAKFTCNCYKDAPEIMKELEDAFNYLEREAYD